MAPVRGRRWTPRRRAGASPARRRQRNVRSRPPAETMIPSSVELQFLGWILQSKRCDLAGLEPCVGREVCSAKRCYRGPAAKSDFRISRYISGPRRLPVCGSDRKVVCGEDGGCCASPIWLMSSVTVASKVANQDGHPGGSHCAMKGSEERRLRSTDYSDAATLTLLGVGVTQEEAGYKTVHHAKSGHSISR